MFRAGDMIGPYTLYERLGQGSFGEVWLAKRRTSLQEKEVAVKFPLGDTADFSRIRREVELWTRVGSHPNILPILEAEVYEGLAVIVSEYAPGGSLSSWLRENDGKAPTASDAIRMEMGVLKGLAHLHGQPTPILHRDLKPANILLRADEPCIADFGLAQLLGCNLSNLTLCGTVPYMAPEVFHNQRTVATDLWAAGVILYEMLAGELPFSVPEAAAETSTQPGRPPCEETLRPASHARFQVSPSMFAIIHRILTQDPQPLPLEIPPPLSAIVWKALAKAPEARFKSAGEMLKALQEAEHETWALSRQRPKSPAAEAPPRPAPQAAESEHGWTLVPIMPEEDEAEPSPEGQKPAPTAAPAAGKRVVTREDVTRTVRGPWRRAWPIPPEASSDEPTLKLPAPPDATPKLEPTPAQSISPPPPDLARPSPPATLPVCPPAEPQPGPARHPLAESPPPPPPSAENPAPAVKTPAKKATPPRSPRPGTSWQDPACGLAFVWAPPGEFQMGARKKWFEGRLADRERPRHKVVIKRGVWIGKYPVTISEYRLFCRETGARPPAGMDAGDWGRQLEGNRPPGAVRLPPPAIDRRPLAGITRHEAAAYCRWLTDSVKGALFRLLSEAEWEYACRAGRLDEVQPRLNDMAWHRGNSDGAVHPVGQKLPNAWGFHDLLGNVMEWCADGWHDNYRGAPADGAPWEQGGDAASGVARGGSWATDPSQVNPTERVRRALGSGFDDLGCRIAREQL